MKVEQFFNQISADYTDMIYRCVPRYEEMLWALFYYLPQNFQPKRILELGCGTGNLSLKLKQQFPDAELVLTDISPDILAQCKQRLGTDSNIRYEQADFRTMEFEADSFDLVTSTISIHHLTDPEKRDLFERVYAWMKPHGIFTYSDQFAGVNAEIYQRHIDRWKEASMALGSTEAEWQTWMDHQKLNDYHAPVVEQINWLDQAGFAELDVPWRYLLWTVIRGQKLAH